MKIKFLITLLTLSLLNLYCSEIQITEYNIKKELQCAADSIKKIKIMFINWMTRQSGKKVISI